MLSTLGLSMNDIHMYTYMCPHTFKHPYTPAKKNIPREKKPGNVPSGPTP